jgi:NadR type nicotinamide-nucleotide adenylyltransferase
MENTTDLKIAILGPESTGKSELANALANHFGVTFIPEYARVYLSDSNHYDSSDVLNIAKKQLELIQNQKQRPLIADTELIVTKIWQLFKYGQVDSWIEENIANQEFDLYLLMNTDLEWTSDDLRENPSLDERQELFDLYEKELRQRNFNYSIISGEGNTRISNALLAIKTLARTSFFK